ncbi:MAG: response regulator [Bacteroidetes bacterium]|nr:response regulator [Bacteroidota bacterium]
MSKIDLTYIVDDDEIILYLAEKLIRKTHFCERLEKFSSGWKALDRLKFSIQVGENVPNLILFDLNMPEMNGWNFIEELNQITQAQNIPTFIFTSSIDPMDIEKSYEYENVLGYIPKPLTTVKLDKMLRLMDGDLLINNGRMRYFNYKELFSRGVI